MSLRGYSLPLSPEGRAIVIPAPPWHYVGDFLVIEYWAEPDAVAAVLPPGLEPFADDPGRCAAAVRRLAVAARTPARSCSTRCAASTRSSSSSSTRCWTAST